MTKSDAALAVSPWKPLSWRRGGREAKRAAVLQAASALIVERGYSWTKLSDVADRLNVTKPTLYNYFTSKDEILLACFEAGNRLIDENFARTERAQVSGMERIRQFVHGYVQIVTQPFGACFSVVDDRELDESSRSQVRRYKRDLDRKLRGMVSEGIKDGSIGECDAKLTVFAIMGALNWIGHWYRVSGDLSPEEIGDAFVEYVTRILLPSRN